MEDKTDDKIKEMLKEKGLPADDFAVVIVRITSFILEREISK